MAKQGFGKSIGCSLLRTKIRKTWAYRKVADVISKLACGEYYLSWYNGKRKRLDPVGSDPEAALAALFEKKRLELAYVATGGEVKQPDNKKASNWPMWRPVVRSSRATITPSATAREN